MKRPWQIWLAFAMVVAFAAAGLTVLTQRAVDLDRSEALARAAADLEARIGGALWRMDTLLSRVLAPEIGRPYFVYEPVLASGGKAPTPSPLLRSPSRFVRLHFQIDPAREVWTSPQVADASNRGVFFDNGYTQGQLDFNASQLQCLACDLQPSTLSDALPQERVEVPQQFSAADSANRRNWTAPQQVEAASQQAEYANSSNDLQDRAGLIQSEAAQQRMQQLDNTDWVVTKRVQEGLSQPLWINGKLLIARRVWFDGREVVQGCWLDWDVLRGELQQRVADLLPDCQLAPVIDTRSVNLNHVLATLPAQVIVSQPRTPPAAWTPIRVALTAAWALFVIGGVAFGLVLRGVLALSERRAAFVSAVTHELRTPLTTFKMYSEMLAQGMVPDPDRQREYLETLQSESQRLAHLVDNVLQYARLERTSTARREVVPVGDLLRQVEERLARRTESSGFELCVECGDCKEWKVATDASAVEQILSNLVDNACKYARAASDRRILIRVSARSAWVIIEVLDFGPGFSSIAKRRLFQPFSKSAEQAAGSAPGVGLGLALCKRLARQLGGDLKLADRGGGAGARLRLQLPRAA